MNHRPLLKKYIHFQQFYGTNNSDFILFQKVEKRENYPNHF